MYTWAYPERHEERDPINLVFLGIHDSTIIEVELLGSGWNRRSVQVHQYLRGWAGFSFHERTYLIKGHPLLRHFWRLHIRLWHVYTRALGYNCIFWERSSRGAGYFKIHW